MRSAPLLPRLPRLILLGTVELGLLPLRFLARLFGGLLLAAAVVGVPAWLTQLALSLIARVHGNGPLPTGEMLLALGGAAVVGILLLRLATLPGPLARVKLEDGSVEFESPIVEEDRREAPRSEPASHDSIGPTDPCATAGWAYRTLGLDSSASAADVKAAYRRLAKLYHPDHNPGFAEEAGERFAHINAAYELLTDEARSDR